MASLPSNLPAADDERSRAARQAEQRRIARLLHDSVSQSLTAVYLQAAVLAQKMGRDGSGSATEVGRLADMLHGVVAELREITRHLSSEEENPADPVSTPVDAARAGPAS